MKGRTEKLWDALPWLLFAALLAVSWNHWILPFQDSGREIGVAYRLAHGDALYRDVQYYYGPLPPYVDAAALRVFGERLGVLIGIRLCLGAAALVLLWRAARRLGAGPILRAGTLCVVVASCAFVRAGAWCFPYCVGALWSIVFLWAALDVALDADSVRGTVVAGVLAGIAAGTKVEILPVALVAVAMPAILRGRIRDAVAGCAPVAVLSALAYGGPLLLLGRRAIDMGPIGTTLHVPAAWTKLNADVFTGSIEPAEFFYGGKWTEVLLPSLPFLLVALFLAHSPGAESRPRAWILFATGIAFSLTYPGSRSMNVFLPASLLLALHEWGVRVLEPGSTVPPPLRRASLTTALVMLPALARQPLIFGNGYGAFATPLALVYATAAIGRRIRVPAVLGLYLLGMSAGQFEERWKDYRGYPLDAVETERGTLVLERNEAGAFRAAIAGVRDFSGPADRVAIFPEGGAVNFLAERLPAFGFEEAYPGCVDERGQDEMIAALGVNPPKIVAVVNRDVSGFLVRYPDLVPPATSTLAWNTRAGLLSAVIRSKYAGAWEVLVPDAISEHEGYPAFAGLPRLWKALSPHLSIERETGPPWDTIPTLGVTCTTTRIYRWVP